MIALLLAFARLARVVRHSWDDPEFRALLTIFAALLATGTVLYAGIEGGSVLDALYFCMATVSTVGYGDVTPHTALGKIFTIVYLPLGIGVFAGLAGKLAVGVLDRPIRRRRTASRPAAPPPSPAPGR